jgi:hypothetical protein
MGIEKPECHGVERVNDLLYVSREVFFVKGFSSLSLRQH